MSDEIESSQSFLFELLLFMCLWIDIGKFNHSTGTHLPMLRVIMSDPFMIQRSLVE